MWTIKTCVRDRGVTTNQAAEFVPFSDTTVYNWLDDYDEGDREKCEWIETVDREMAGGRRGSKIYRQYHDRVRRADGWYCFVVYRPHGRSGCTVLDDKMVRAGALPLIRRHGGGDHRDTQQAKLGIDELF